MTKISSQLTPTIRNLLDAFVKQKADDQLPESVQLRVPEECTCDNCRGRQFAHGENLPSEEEMKSDAAEQLLRLVERCTTTFLAENFLPTAPADVQLMTVALLLQEAAMGAPLIQRLVGPLLDIARDAMRALVAQIAESDQPNKAKKLFLALFNKLQEIVSKNFPRFKNRLFNKEELAELMSEIPDEDTDEDGDTGPQETNEEADENMNDSNVNRVQKARRNSDEDEYEFKNVKVTREGEKITVPEGMSMATAIKNLEQQRKEEETLVEVSIIVDAYPFEGARAFQMAMSEKFGWVNSVPTPGFFGPTPPTMITIDVDIEKTEQIIWGRFEIPAIEGFLVTDFTVQDGRFLFQISGTVKKKSMHLVNGLGDLTKKKIKEFSLYKGKAVRFAFPDPNDRNSFTPTNCPKFIDTSKIRGEDLIFSDDITNQIDMAIFNRINYTQECRDEQVPLKSGTLLAGTFGVGKSMAASVTAMLCVKNGWTFFYLEKAEQLPGAIRFARSYQPAVIFVEDVDKITKGERNKQLDELLNVIDGVDTKNSEIMLVFTTNALNVINPAVLRAGRLDHIVEVLPPDALAVERLIKLYTRGNLDPHATLNRVGGILAGQIPATISDVCTRARLSALPRRRQTGTLQINEEDLITAANGKLKELELVKSERPTAYGNSAEKAAHILATGIVKAASDAFTVKHESNGNGKTHERAPLGLPPAS